MNDNIRIATTQAQQNVANLRDKVSALASSIGYLKLGLVESSKGFDGTLKSVASFARQIENARKVTEQTGRSIVGQMGVIQKKVNQALVPSEPGLARAVKAFETGYLQKIQEMNNTSFKKLKQIKAEDLVDNSSKMSDWANGIIKGAEQAHTAIKFIEQDIDRFKRGLGTRINPSSFLSIDTAKVTQTLERRQTIVGAASNVSAAAGTVSPVDIGNLKKGGITNAAVVNDLATSLDRVKPKLAGLQQSFQQAFVEGGLRGIHEFDDAVSVTTLDKFERQLKKTRSSITALGDDGVKFAQDFINGQVKINDLVGDDPRTKNLRAIGVQLERLHGIHAEHIQDILKTIQAQDKLTAAEQETSDKERAKVALTTRTKQAGVASSQFAGTLQAPKNIDQLLGRAEQIEHLKTALVNYEGEIPNLIQLYRGVQAGTIAVTNDNSALVRSLHSLASSIPPPINNLKKLAAETRNTRGSFDILARFLEFRVVSQAFYSFTNALQGTTDEMLKFGTAVAQIQTIGQKQPLVFDQWAESLRGLSTEFNIPLIDVANAAYEGLSNQIAEGTDLLKFQSDAAILSKAAVGSLADSVNVLSSEINSFNLDAQAASRLNDELFRGVDLGRFKIQDLGDSYGHTTVLAGQLGLRTGELTAAMTTLTRLGVPVSEAQTQITNVLNKLLTPTKELTKLYKVWGVESGEAAIKTFGFTGVIEKLGTASEGGAGVLEDLFKRIQAFKGALALTSFIDQYKSDLQDIEHSEGSALKAAETVMQNHAQIIETEIQRFKNNLEKELETIGKQVADWQKLRTAGNEKGQTNLDAGDVATIGVNLLALGSAYFVVTKLSKFLTSATQQLGFGYLQASGQLALLDAETAAAVKSIGYFAAAQEIANVKAAQGIIENEALAASFAQVGAAASASASGIEAGVAAAGATAVGIGAAGAAVAEGGVALEAGAVAASAGAAEVAAGAATAGLGIASLASGIPEALAALAALYFGYKALSSIIGTIDSKSIDNITNAFKKLNETDLTNLTSGLNKARQEFIETADVVNKVTLGSIAQAKSTLNAQSDVIDEAFKRMSASLKSNYKTMSDEQRKNLEQLIDLQVSAVKEKFDRAVSTKQIRGKRNEAAGRHELAENLFNTAQQFADGGDQETAQKFLSASKSELDSIVQLLGRRANVEKEYNQILETQANLHEKIAGEGAIQYALRQQQANAANTINGYDTVAEQIAKRKQKLMAAQLDSFIKLASTGSTSEAEFEAAATRIQAILDETKTGGSQITTFDEKTGKDSVTSFQDLFDQKVSIKRQRFQLDSAEKDATQLQTDEKTTADKKTSLFSQRQTIANGLSEGLLQSLGEAQKQSGGISGLLVSGRGEQITKQESKDFFGKGAQSFAAEFRDALASGDTNAVQTLAKQFFEQNAKLNENQINLGSFQRTRGAAAVGNEGLKQFNEQARLVNQLAADHKAATSASNIEDPEAKKAAVKALSEQGKKFFENISGLKDVQDAEKSIEERKADLADKQAALANLPLEAERKKQVKEQILQLEAQRADSHNAGQRALLGGRITDLKASVETDPQAQLKAAIEDTQGKLFGTHNAGQRVLLQNRLNDLQSQLQPEDQKPAIADKTFDISDAVKSTMSLNDLLSKSAIAKDVVPVEIMNQTAIKDPSLIQNPPIADTSVDQTQTIDNSVAPSYDAFGDLTEKYVPPVVTNPTIGAGANYTYNTSVNMAQSGNTAMDSTYLANLSNGTAIAQRRGQIA